MSAEVEPVYLGPEILTLDAVRTIIFARSAAYRKFEKEG